MRTVLKAALLVLVLTGGGHARQFKSPAPAYPSGPTYSYCAAKAHVHAHLVTAYAARWGGQGLVESACNNGGNNFYGNTLRADTWGGQKVYWYDWSASTGDSARKQAMWGFTLWEPLTIHYCPVCLVVVEVSSP
jgi:hypothetical protein